MPAVDLDDPIIRLPKPMTGFNSSDAHHRDACLIKLQAAADAHSLLITAGCLLSEYRVAATNGNGFVASTQFEVIGCIQGFG